MLKYLVAYVATAVVFLGLDFAWLSSMLGTYRAQLGDLLREQPNLMVAAGFYLLYAAGIVVLVVAPALEEGDWVRALWTGAVLGLVAYGTYDITNLSTVRGWAVGISLLDLAWGTVLTAVSATAGLLITRWILG